MLHSNTKYFLLDWNFGMIKNIFSWSTAILRRYLQNNYYTLKSTLHNWVPSGVTRLGDLLGNLFKASFNN